MITKVRNQVWHDRVLKITGESMYPEIMVIPMREELTRLGIEELRSAADVDRVLQNEPGTTMWS